MNETVDKIPLSKVFVVNSVSATESLTPIVTPARVRIMTGVTMSRCHEAGTGYLRPAARLCPPRRAGGRTGAGSAATPPGTPGPSPSRFSPFISDIVLCDYSIRGGQGSDQLIMPSESL